MSTSKPSILLVDDDPDIQLLYTAKLSSLGYQVRSACDGISCVASIERDRPDLVILDLGLPAGDGESALRILRSKQKLADLPVLILSAREESEWGDHLREVGATAYLQKPAQPDHLVATVMSLLENRPMPQARRPKPIDRVAMEAPTKIVPIEAAADVDSAPSVLGETPKALDAAPSMLPQQLGALSCPHCGHAVAGLLAKLDPAAIEALVRAHGEG